MSEPIKQGELYRKAFENFRCEPYDWVCVAPTKDYPENERLITIEQVRKVLDAARADFPKYPTPLPEKDYTKDKWAWMLDEWDSKVQDWFKRWFGGVPL